MNLYDLLDVDESATREEIRAAWKAATADLDPTDRRFRAFNDAAGVLLDEDKRAAYDAELAADREAEGADGADGEPAVAETPAPAVVATEEPAATVPADEPEAATPAPAAAPDEPAEPGGSDEPDETPAPAAPADGASASRTGGPPRWAVVTAVAVGVVSLLLLVAVLALPGTLGGESPNDRADAADDAASSAEDAVRQLVPIVLAYDYRQLDDDIEEASSYLTPEFAAEREEFFEKPVLVDGEPLLVDGESVTFREQVVQEKLVVVAEDVGVGVTRVSEDGDVAKVVAFINQASRKGKAAPQTLEMWATLTLERDGSRWLLDDICTESDCF